MTKLRRILLPLLLAAVTLIVPSLILSALQFDGAGGIVTLAAIAAALVTLVANARVGITTSVILAILVGLALLASSVWILAAGLLAVSAAAMGATARFGWQMALTTGPMALGFIVATQPQLAEGSRLLSALVLAVAVAVFGLLATLLAQLIAKGLDPKPLPVVSASRANAYAGLLAITTFATTALVVAFDWGHAGGWLIMTPLLVLQPYVQEGWSRSLRRGLGTLIGFVIAYVIVILIPWTPVLVIIAIGFMAGAIAAQVRDWDYAVFAAALTPGIVILTGLETDLVETDLRRLAATVLGVGISLAIMAIAAPLYRRRARELGLEKY